VFLEEPFAILLVSAVEHVGEPVRKPAAGES